MHALCGVVWDMHVLVREVIKPQDVVMEFGGRYGTTTCAIASVQNNSGALIAVEPDPKVWAIQEVGCINDLSSILTPSLPSSTS